VSIARQSAVIVLAGGLLGVAATAASPRPAHLARPIHALAEAGEGQCAVPGGPVEPASARIGVDEAKGLCDACRAAFVDARGASEYAAGHVTNAIHLPPAKHPEASAAVAALRAYPLVVVYDGDYSCAVADEVAARLRRAGLPDVRVLEGAWPAWVAAGGSGASGWCPDCHAEESR
jgi:3-mercaptopyruvate sulfurtransferase SseA